MSFLPDWAPNLHPMLVHFPIGWLIAAIMVDLFAATLPLSAALPRPAWAQATVTWAAAQTARARRSDTSTGAVAMWAETTATWAEATATFLYATGSVSTLAAYVSGLQASETVFTPGLAHATVDLHRNWALATTIYFGVLAVVRLIIYVTNWRPPVTARAALTFVALGGLFLLFFTGDLGARLVYEYGVGVSGGWRLEPVP